jgi:ketosteroid isomerase-like protein
MEMLVSEDKVLVVGMQRAVAKASGVHLEQPTHTVWTFREGRVVRQHWTLDRQEALEVAGLQKST